MDELHNITRSLSAGKEIISDAAAKPCSSAHLNYWVYLMLEVRRAEFGGGERFGIHIDWMG